MLSVKADSTESMYRERERERVRVILAGREGWVGVVRGGGSRSRPHISLSTDTEGKISPRGPRKFPDKTAQQLTIFIKLRRKTIQPCVLSTLFHPNVHK